MTRAHQRTIAGRTAQQLDFCASFLFYIIPVLFTLIAHMNDAHERRQFNWSLGRLWNVSCSLIDVLGYFFLPLHRPRACSLTSTDSCTLSLASHRMLSFSSVFGILILPSTCCMLHQVWESSFVLEKSKEEKSKQRSEKNKNWSVISITRCDGLELCQVEFDDGFDVVIMQREEVLLQKVSNGD